MGKSYLHPDTPQRETALDGSTIYTVSDLTREIRDILEEGLGRIWLTGEISNCRRPASGHCYFTLKDEHAQISAVMWRTLAGALPFDVKDGQAVLVQGELTVYEPRGQYQLVVRRIEPRGVGALQLAFSQLKEKLGREGLFDEERKKPLPLIPRRIALVTSPTGAAIRDMLNIILRRFPRANVLICPARVQGKSAAGEIAQAIARADALDDVDVIIAGRGGGSLEDLWPFNEEVVARAIAACGTPLVSAVGHETDFTISDFVADVRALTPTDAGTRVTPDMAQLAEALGIMSSRLGQGLMRRSQLSHERLDGLAYRMRLRSPLERARMAEQRLDDLGQRLLRSARQVCKSQRERFDHMFARLESLSPLAVLYRGYSVAMLEDGTVIRNPAQVSPGDIIRIRAHKGEFRAQVVKDEPKPPRKPARKKAATPKTQKKTATRKTTPAKLRKKDGKEKS
jgi:exodeoxyribonuclease VII large subunit